MKYKINENNLRSLIRKAISEAYDSNDNWDDDWDGYEDDNEPTDWDNYISNYDNDPSCPFNRFSEGMDPEELEELLKFCFHNEFLYYHSGRWSAANTKGIQCAIMSDIANDPVVGATHEADEMLRSRLESEMSYGTQYAVIKINSRDGVYFMLYED